MIDGGGCPDDGAALSVAVGGSALGEPLTTQLHQRSVALATWLGENPEWGSWLHDNGSLRRLLTVSWNSSRGRTGRSGVRVQVDPERDCFQLVEVSVLDHASNYAAASAPEAVTLQFISGLDALLVNVADHLGRSRPAQLPRTRRERRWLDEGHPLPEPSSFLTRPIKDARRHVEALSAAQFWAIVRALDGDVERRERRLRGQLRKLRLAELAGFHVRFVEVTRSLYTHQLWAVAEDALGFMSDDAFTDLRCWIALQGEASHDLIRGNPTRLVDLLRLVGEEEIGAAEVLAAVPEDVYVERTGRFMSGDYHGVESHHLDEAPPQGPGCRSCC